MYSSDKPRNKENVLTVGANIVEVFGEYQKSVRSPNGDPAERKRLFSEILAALKIGNTELAGKLGVAPITVQRWADIGIAPRAALLDRLGEICLGRTPLPVQAGVLGSSKPVPFGNAAAGLWDVSHFFERARFSKRIYVFKTLVPFLARDSAELRAQLLQILGSDRTREIHYFYPKDSETEASFYEMRDVFLYGDRKEGFQIKGHEIKESDRAGDFETKLFGGQVSPFILELSKEEQIATQGRLVEMLLEVPVQSYEPSGAIVDFGYRQSLVWVEFPHSLAHKIWLDVRKQIYEATEIAFNDKGDPYPSLESQLEERCNKRKMDGEF
jgi:hypothetical protein